MWPGLGLCFILLQVVCPLRIIFNRRLEPELAGGEHGCRQVQVTRCEIRAAEVSQLSCMVTGDTRSGIKRKRQNLGGIVCVPAACEFLTDFPNRVYMWKIVTMLWVLENTVVNRCFDQACLDPVVSSNLQSCAAATATLPSLSINIQPWTSG